MYIQQYVCMPSALVLQQYYSRPTSHSRAQNATIFAPVGSNFHAMTRACSGVPFCGTNSTINSIWHSSGRSVFNSASRRGSVATALLATTSTILSASGNTATADLTLGRSSSTSPARHTTIFHCTTKPSTTVFSRTSCRKVCVWMIDFALEKPCVLQV